LKPDSSTRGICNRLNLEGIPSPTGRKWTPVTVPGILTNPTYTGRYVRCRGGSSTAKYHHVAADGSVVPKNGAPVQQIVIPDACPAIISQADFDEVQARLAGRVSHRGRREADGTVRYLFSRLLRCGALRTRMSGDVWHDGGKKRYKCSRYHALGRAENGCELNYVHETEMLEMVAEQISRQFGKDKPLERLRRALEKAARRRRLRNHPRKRSG
jgi:hypothetical protein